MKSHLLFVVVLSLFASLARVQSQPVFTNANQKYNYALGQDIVSTFKQMEVEIDLKAFVAGMNDALAGKPALTTEQQQAGMQELARALSVKSAERRKVLAAKNLKEGEAFMAANATKEGVKVKEALALDGTKVEFQYKVLKSGSGPSPSANGSVEVHYVGTLIDGTEFDSSLKRGTPATFEVNNVVPGWRAALPMMRVGDKWQLIIPPKLAYGEGGPPHVGPNSTLIFELELLGVSPPSAGKK